jgi:hypothetical protein
MVVLATAIYLMAAAVAFAAAPIAALLFWQLWPDELPKYQALFGALIALFAAGLASLGVALTIFNQRRIVDRQLAAQRVEQDRARSHVRQQIASAFIGEIGVIIEELNHEMLQPVLQTTLDDIKATPAGNIRVTTVRIGKRISRYYESNPANVGLFPNRIPEELTRFYSTVEEVKLDLESYCDVVSAYTDQGKAKMSVPQLVYILQKTISNIDLCLKSGSSIIEHLKSIRDANPRRD